MIKDEVQVVFTSGKGGNGGAKFSRTAQPYPTGGFGGKGGDVYLEGAVDLYDFRYMNEDFRFKAEDGQEGGANQQRGRNGNDLIIKVPLITEVFDQHGTLVAKVTKKGESILLLKGGNGGLGNHYFRKGFEGRFDHYTPGGKAEVLEATLQLKLVADIVFIGFPNAGKSSLLNALTNATAKVGNYPFTTLSPHLGRMPGVTLMDLPGLIEGTVHGKGLGTGFIKHTEYAKVIAHIISLESGDLLADYTKMRTELKAISSELAAKPEIIVLTKSDLFDADEVTRKIHELDSIDAKKITISAYLHETLKELEQAFKHML